MIFIDIMTARETCCLLEHCNCSMENTPLQLNVNSTTEHGCVIEQRRMETMTAGSMKYIGRQVNPASLLLFRIGERPSERTLNAPLPRSVVLDVWTGPACLMLGCMCSWTSTCTLCNLQAPVHTLQSHQAPQTKRSRVCHATPPQPFLIPLLDT